MANGVEGCPAPQRRLRVEILQKTKGTSFMNTIRSLVRTKSIKRSVLVPLTVGLAIPALCSVAFVASAQQSKSKSESKSMPKPYGFQPTATVADVMEYVVMPTAQRLWDAVAVDVTKQGILEKAPKTDADWAAVRGDALTLAEMANALMIPGRRTDKPGAVSEYPEDELSGDQIEALREKNWGAWVAHAQVLHTAVMESIKAIDARDKDKLSDAGGALDEACESCHLEFWYPPKPGQKQ